MKLSMMSCSCCLMGRPADEVIALALSNRMAYVDWIGTHGLSAVELAEKTRSAGLKCCCHTFFLHSFLEGKGKSVWTEELKRHLDDAGKLGAPMMMLPMQKLPGKSRREGQKIWFDAVAEYASLSEGAGVIPTVENYPGETSPLVTADDFFELKKRIPSLKLTFDDGNVTCGENMRESLKRCFSDVVHVHLKDWYIRTEAAEGFFRGLDGRWYKPALIGEGMVDTAGCLKYLKEKGYSGCINLEYEDQVYSPADAMRKAAAFCAPYL